MTEVKANICGIILAAGISSRMGKTKQLLLYKGSPILSHVMKNALASNLSSVIVVLGHDAEKIKKNIDFSLVCPVLNRGYKTGQASSLKKGLKAVTGPCDGAMFLLGDQPRVDKSVINTLINALLTSDDSIIIPCYRKKRGNPVIIAEDLFPEINDLDGDTGARVLFKKYKNNILKININDPAILVDVDTPEDYKKLNDTVFYSDNFR
jgi:molybdenum cofactor cytidylyltransferase